MHRLIGDFDLNEIQAAGIVGNLGHECAGFHTLHEIGQPEGKGGYGWAQWTGDRRKSFLAWCDKRKLGWETDAANYGYLSSELHGTYARSISALEKAYTLEASVVAFERSYEGAGVPNYPSRNEWASIALDSFRTR